MIKAWLKQIEIKFKKRLEYRAEFIMSIFTMFALELFAPLFTVLIYYNSNGFEGWGL